VVVRTKGHVLFAPVFLVALFVCARPVESLSLAPSQITSPISCEAVRAVETDFDQNGIADRVAVDDEDNDDALRLVLNDTEAIALVHVPTCELSAFDFDHDHDIDLIALDSRGDLLVWQNDDGKLRRLEPRHRTHTDFGHTSLNPAVRAHRSAVNAGSTAGIVDRRGHALALAVDRHYALLTSVDRSLTLNPRWLARPPPAISRAV
jgi:hypothetical protein